MVDAGLPEGFLIGLGDTLLPVMGQAIVPTYNLPTLGANQTLVRFYLFNNNNNNIFIYI